MTATSANLTQATSSNFSVTGPGPIDQIVLSGCASSIWWGASCTVTAAADDAWGNLATSYSGGLDGFTFAQTGGSGAVTGLTTVTALNGVASDTVTGSVVGTLQVNATDPTAPSVASSTLTITVVGIPQTVAFYTDNTYSTVITTGTTTYLAAGTYATYAQGSGSGTITFASLTPSICSVNSSSGLVALLGAGTCNLTADAGATPHYADSGTTTFALTINRGTNAITVTSPAPGSASVGGATYTPTATATSGDTVVITSATTSVCTISSGKVSFLIVGSCTLNFNDVGNTNYLAAPQVQQTFAIAQGANNITITSTAPGSAVVGGATYTPTATATSGDTVAITSGSTSVCTITGGVVSFVTAGSCSIDFNDAGNTNYLAAPQAVQTFSVGKGANAITITSTAPNPGVGPIGPTYTPTATATSGDTVVITSATTPVCTVTAGVVSFVTNGTCTLDFNDVGNANYVAAAQVVQTFSVKHSNAITITSTAPGSPVVGGATYHATATATSSDAVVITSGTTSVCTVASGIVSFVTAGTCTLDFNDVGNATYVAAVQATQTFTVGQGANTITVTSTAPGAAVVSGATYHATATATSGDAVVITSGTTGVCTVSSGIVTFVGAGSCSIDFNDAGNTNYVAAAQVVQTFNVGRGANTITITSTAPNPGVAPSGATYTPTATATSGDTVVVTSSTTGVCTVTGGVVSFVTYGTCTLDFNDAGNGNYVAATQQVQTVSVKHTNAITITSTAPGSAVVGGATYTPTATATSSDTVSITSATPSVCTFNGFVATFVASGSCTLDFNDVGNTNYVAAGQAVQTFTVGQGANAITVTSTAPNPARAGSTYTATATATSGDTVVITSATTTICSVSGNTVTLIKIGTCTLDFNDAGNGNYVAATQQVQTFTVVVGFGYLGGNLSADTSNTVATSAALTAPLNTSMLIMVSDYGSVAQTCTAPTGGAIGAVTVTLLSNATSWYSAGGAFYGMCVYSAEATGNTSTVTETMAATTSEMAIQVFDVLGDTAATFSLPGAASGNSAAPAFTLSGAPAAGTSEVLFGDTTNNSTTLASTWTNNTPTGFTQAATPEVQTWGTFGNARSFDAAVSFGTSSTQTLTGAISALSRWGTIAIEVIQ
jgi:lipopolysaccharide export system protein LptC